MKKNLGGLLLFIIITIALVIMIGCGSAPVIKNAESDAEIEYKTGLVYLERKNYEEAEKAFMRVITEFSFSKFEPFATIGLADTYYGKEEYPSAVEVLKRFLTMRPNHEKADYATFQMGNCFYEQRPSEFFLLPAPEEKDMDVVEKAVEQYRAYKKSYPNGQYKKEAEDQLEKAEGLLISREIKVAEFYKKQDKCPAVNMRLKYIRDNFKVTSEKVLAEMQKLEAKCPQK